MKPRATHLIAISNVYIAKNMYLENKGNVKHDSSLEFAFCIFLEYNLSQTINDVFAVQNVKSDIDFNLASWLIVLPKKLKALILIFMYTRALKHRWTCDGDNLMDF